MRNLRKLTAVVIAIALVLTSMTAAFAASTTYEFEAQATVLKDLGIWTGDAKGDLMLGKALTRAEGAVLVLKTVLGKTDADAAAADASGIAKFADAAKVPSWAKGWIALAVKEGVVNGTTDNKLNADASLLGKDLASMFMNSLGFSAENQYAKAVELLAAKSKGTILTGIAKDLTDVELTRDAATAVVYDTLTVTAKDAKETVIAKYVGTDATKLATATKAGLIASTAGLDVASVTATNLRELVVTFNKAPDADQAKKTANYKIGDNNPANAILSADGKTVTLRTYNDKAMGNYGTVDLTVLKAVGFDADKVIKGIAVKDTTVPSVTSVKTTGPRTIKVTLSEVLDEATFTNVNGSVKVDAGLIAIDTNNVTISSVDLDVEMTIKTLSDLSEGSHKIEFTSDTKLADNAGYKLQAATLTFDYVKDTSELTLSVAESSEKSVTVKFNKAIDAGTFKGNADVSIAHTYNTDSRKTKANKEGFITNSGDDQKFTINFPDDQPLPPGTTTVYINGADKVKDNYGNTLKTTSFTVTTTADLTKPTATAEFVDANEIKVTYSEKVKKADDVNNYVLKIGSDVIPLKSATVVADSDGKIYTLAPSSTNGFNGTTYSLTIKNVEDVSIASNPIDEVTLTFTGTDKVPPTVDQDASKLVAKNKYKVVFSEAMNVDSITTKSLYKITPSTNIEIDKVEAVDGNKAALITFKSDLPSGSYKITVGYVKDVAGNNTADFTNDTKTFTQAVKLVALDSYQITGKTSVKLKFKDVLNSMVYTDFAYSYDGTNWESPKAISVNVVDSETYITLETKTDLPNSTGAGISVKSVPGTDGKTKAKNAFDTTLGFNSVADGITAEDKCAPWKVGDISYSAQADGKTTGKKTLDTVTITYSEDIYAASLQESDYTVSGYEIDKVEVSKNVVTITVKKLDYGSYTVGTKYTVKVKQVGEIQDKAKNTLGAQDEWSIEQTVN